MYEFLEAEGPWRPQHPGLGVLRPSPGCERIPTTGCRFTAEAPLRNTHSGAHSRDAPPGEAVTWLLRGPRASTTKRRPSRGEREGGGSMGAHP